ncbi:MULTISPECIES: M20 family metallo-hydrolase [Clostridium]|uniref:M20 family metallo-hydrolase n=1 Tax=Clostridium lapidicellarium TaxID=3240931 RepID=A0ABV4DT36_9CLOT
MKIVQKVEKIYNDYKILGEWFNKFSTVGRQKTGGVTRLAYSSEEDEMHRIFKDISEDLGFAVETDGVGNTFVGLQKNKNKRCYLIGSHLDSVPNGGIYDGVLGVIGGLLILKWIKDNNIDIPVKVVAFRCEESSAFGKATIGSGLVTGKVKEEELCNFKNKKGESLKDILKSKGFLTKSYKLGELEGYIEIHIEQGRVLWDKNIELGIVTSIAAPKRFKLSIYGRQDHSGATPMMMRKDALSTASEVILEIEKLGRVESIYSTVATVGEIYETPNALNVVPGFVELGIDIRGIESKSINRVVSELKNSIKRITDKRGLNYKLTMTSSSEPVKLDDTIVKGLKRSSEKLKLSCIEMPSGAGHDAMEFADITKTGMVFIPCREGISHNPKENASLKQLYNACKIVCEYLKEVSL